jgi:hypothetical protein
LNEVISYAWAEKKSQNGTSVKTNKTIKRNQEPEATSSVSSAHY